MPIYEYRCADCGHELEAIQKFSDEPLTECPACGSSGLRRKISAAAFRLKGGGWYETDFKKDKRRNVVADGDGSGGKSASANDGGSDKSAATAAPASADKAKTSTGGSGPTGAGTSGPGSSAGRTA